MSADFIVGDVEALEDGLVEHPPLGIVAASIEFAGILQELQTSLDQSRCLGKVVSDGVEAPGEPVAVSGDVAELGLDLGLGECIVSREIDEVGFFSVERLQLRGDLLTEQAVALLLVPDGGGKVTAHVRGELLVESDCGVVPLESLLDEGDVDVGCLASALLPVPAEEVQVLDAVPVYGPLDDHPSGRAVAYASSAE